MEEIFKPEGDVGTGDKTPESPISESDKQTISSLDSQISKDVVPAGDVRLKKGRGKKKARKYVLKEEYIDIIKDTFWESKPWILG